MATPLAGLLASGLYLLSIRATGLPLEMGVARLALVGALAALVAALAGLGTGRRLRRAGPVSLL